MVIRVVLCLSFLILALGSPCTSEAFPAGPSCYPQPSCAPAPCPPMRAPCGPPAPPLAFCAGILGSCSSICGAALGCPAAIMRILLAPPPRRCRPPRCASWCGPPQPMYAPSYAAPPPIAPRRIAKCPPGAAGAVHPPVSYGPPRTAAPICTPQAPCGRMGCPLFRQGSLNQDEMPVFTLASGSLAAPPRAFGPVYADTPMLEGPQPGLAW